MSLTSTQFQQLLVAIMAGPIAGGYISNGEAFEQAADSALEMAQELAGRITTVERPGGN